MGDVVVDWLIDPENTTKVYLAINLGMILTNMLIAVGALFFVLRLIEFL